MDAVSGESADVQLLVRDAAVADAGAVANLLSTAGCDAFDHDVCEPGRSSVVLYDPAGDDIYGAATIRLVAEDTFVVLGVAVRGLPDPDAARVRLVREVADQARRAGGERLVADADAIGVSQSVLTVVGFEVVGFEVVRGALEDFGRSMMYLEL